MNKYYELVQRIDRMESLLRSYRAGTDKDFVVFDYGCLYGDSTLRYKELSIEVPENLNRDLRAAMLNLYEYVEEELAESLRKLSIANELLEK